MLMRTAKTTHIHRKVVCVSCILIFFKQHVFNTLILQKRKIILCNVLLGQNSLQKQERECDALLDLYHA